MSREKDVRITLTKTSQAIKQLNYAVLAAGTAGGVWFDEESEKAHSSLGNHSSTEGKSYDA